MKIDDQEEMEESEEWNDEDRKGDDHLSGNGVSREEAVRKAREQAFIGFGKQFFGSNKSSFCGVAKMNIISMNVAGGKQAKDNPSEFVSFFFSFLSATATAAASAAAMKRLSNALVDYIICKVCT